MIKNDTTMYEADTKERVRTILGSRLQFVEKNMFGGTAFMVNGKMVIGTNKAGDIMLKFHPNDVKKYIATTAAKEQTMGRRIMKNWLTLDHADIVTEGELEIWIDRALEISRS